MVEGGSSIVAPVEEAFGDDEGSEEYLENMAFSSSSVALDCSKHGC